MHSKWLISCLFKSYFVLKLIWQWQQIRGPVKRERFKDEISIYCLLLLDTGGKRHGGLLSFDGVDVTAGIGLLDASAEVEVDVTSRGKMDGGEVDGGDALPSGRDGRWRDCSGGRIFPEKLLRSMHYYKL